MELRESEFRSWLKKRLEDKGCFVENIESTTKNGIPDQYIILDGIPFWLELKVDPKKEKPLIRKEQRIWGIKHQRRKGKAWILHYIESAEYCYVFEHPIKEIELVGKFLRVLDPPVMVFPKKRVYEYLSCLVKELPEPKL